MNDIRPVTRVSKCTEQRALRVLLRYPIKESTKDKMFTLFTRSLCSILRCYVCSVLNWSPYHSFVRLLYVFREVKISCHKTPG